METFKFWKLERDLPPLHSRFLSLDFHVICPSFDRRDAEDVAQRLEVPKIMQVTFYAMVMNDALELGILHDAVARILKIVVVDPNWFSFEFSFDIHKM